LSGFDPTQKSFSKSIGWVSLLPFFDETESRLHRHAKVEGAFHAHFDNFFPIHGQSRCVEVNKLAPSTNDINKSKKRSKKNFIQPIDLLSNIVSEASTSLIARGELSCQTRIFFFWMIRGGLRRADEISDQGRGDPRAKGFSRRRLFFLIRVPPQDAFGVIRLGGYPLQIHLRG
jgi:hypothetical protein